jgi:muconolactone delta-isomerase
MPIGSDDILWSAISTVEEKLLPAIEDNLARSLCFTLANMLRFVRVRLEHEGADLTQSIAEARGLLARVSTPDAQGALQRVFREPGAYPTLSSLYEEIDGLHQALDIVLADLKQDGGSKLRSDILTHLRAHHERIDGWCQSAFTGLRR